MPPPIFSLVTERDNILSNPYWGQDLPIRLSSKDGQLQSQTMALSKMTTSTAPPGILTNDLKQDIAFRRSILSNILICPEGPTRFASKYIEQGIPICRALEARIAYIERHFGVEVFSEGWPFIAKEEIFLRGCQDLLIAASRLNPRIISLSFSLVGPGITNRFHALQIIFLEFMDRYLDDLLGK